MRYSLRLRTSTTFKYVSEIFWQPHSCWNQKETQNQTLWQSADFLNLAVGTKESGLVLTVRYWRVVHRLTCFATGPYTLPKRVLQRMWSSASSIKFQCFHVSSGSSSTFFRLLARLLFSFIYPSITCFKSQLLSKTWPINLAFLRLVWKCSFLH